MLIINEILSKNSQNVLFNSIINNNFYNVFKKETKYFIVYFYFILPSEILNSTKISVKYKDTFPITKDQR